MDPNLDNQQNIQTPEPKIYFRTYLIVFAAIIGLILLFSLPFTIVALTSSRIHNGIEIAGIDVSKLSKDEAVKRLEEAYSNAGSSKLILRAGDKEESITFSELDVSYDTKAAVERAYQVGREGWVLKRLYDITKYKIKGAAVELPISYDDAKLAEIAEKLSQDIGDPVVDDSYEVRGNRLYFTFGHSGRGIDKRKIVSEVGNKIKSGKGGELSFKVEEIHPKSLNSELVSETPKDATYKVENFEIKYIPEVVGVRLDKKLFDIMIKENSKYKVSFDIAVEAIRPKITVEELKAMLFKDTLGGYETFYGSSPDNRKSNVRLAASKVGGVVLAPGDEFSYNKVVGKRTIERGFKLAHAYSNGKIIDDVGGGICQVSSTLYNAVINADLGIVERKNHMFTVSYVPAGMDATVNYGTVDFKFKNTNPWPIKIVNNTTPTNVSFKILGTNTELGKTVEFKKETIKVIPFATKEVPDPTQFVGKKVFDQKGQNGFVVNVYKITKQNGVVIKEEFLHKDTYQPLTAVVKVGTKPAPIVPDTPGDINGDTPGQYGNDNNSEPQGTLVPVIDEEGPPPTER